jgi:hypothetical protein
MIKIKTEKMNPFLIIAVAILVIVAAPLLVISSLNTLFPALLIPYTFGTWFATAFLVSVFSFGKTKE